MRTKPIVVGVTLVVALLVVGLIVAVHRGSLTSGSQGDTTAITVLVANQDIGAGTILDPLIADDNSCALKVPNDLIVEGVVVERRQLQGRIAGARRSTGTSRSR